MEKGRQALRPRVMGIIVPWYLYYLLWYHYIVICSRHPIDQPLIPSPLFSISSAGVIYPTTLRYYTRCEEKRTKINSLLRKFVFIFPFSGLYTFVLEPVRWRRFGTYNVPAQRTRVILWQSINDVIMIVYKNLINLRAPFGHIRSLFDSPAL